LCGSKAKAAEANHIEANAQSLRRAYMMVLMHTSLFALAAFALGTWLALLAGAAALHLIPRLGAAGQRIGIALCRAPGLDAVITYFTVLPLLVGGFVASWHGLLGAVVGQVLAVLTWVQIHELLHRNVIRGPRIVKSINSIIGPFRNHAALWVTAIITPLFWLVRIAEILFYPILRWLVGFPKYNDGDWVNVSRQKFSGLVGHDLIWCLYCDWMTGIWSLGSEMLRNVESFWCPIRFYNNKKCENCAVDFPDVADGWIAPNGNIEQAAALVKEMHGGGDHSWFGKRATLSIKGKTLEMKVSSDPAPSDL
jgi:hypothetical protein